MHVHRLTVKLDAAQRDSCLLMSSMSSRAVLLNLVCARVMQDITRKHQILSNACLELPLLRTVCV